MLERIGGMVGIGQVVASERDDDLRMTRGKHTLMAVDCPRIAGVPEPLHEGSESGMGARSR